LFCFPFIFLSPKFPAGSSKSVPEQEFPGVIWLIDWLCERAFRSRLTLREEGQAQPLRRRPTDLPQVRLCQTATEIVNAILPNRSCNSMHVYEVRPRKDKRGVDLISAVLPFGRLWYGGPNAIRQCS